MSKDSIAREIPDAFGLIDVNADNCGVTSYTVNGDALINLSFLKQVAVPYLDQEDQPGSIKISPIRVASINMSNKQAFSLMKALQHHLEKTEVK